MLSTSFPNLTTAQVRECSDLYIYIVDVCIHMIYIVHMHTHDIYIYVYIHTYMASSCSRYSVRTAPNLTNTSVSYVYIHILPMHTQKHSPNTGARAKNSMICIYMASSCSRCSARHSPTLTTAQVRKYESFLYILYIHVLHKYTHYIRIYAGYTRGA